MRQLKKKSPLKALFQIDPISKLNPKTDSTIAIIKEALDLGISVYLCSPQSLVYSGKKTLALCHHVLNNDYLNKIIINSSFKVKNCRLENITLFDFYFIRQDPPVDMSYLTNCYLLETHSQFNKKPFFVNNPAGIKNFTEKIFPLYFEELIPETLITSNLNAFEKMLNKNKVLIVKNLYNKGGEGVFKVHKGPVSNKLFKKSTNHFKMPVVIQEFIDEVIHGDKRIILINGDPVGAINRIPKEGNFKANLHLGGTPVKTSLTKTEKKICSILKPFLKKNGLFFVGIDIINEKLTEINVTSPTGITQIDSLYKTNISKTIWSKLLKIFKN